ncbi:Phospholipase A-2-activating protein [Trichinella pseudospiralis]|uniref:Phospholipase A-2-activating protein n=3 Tax=Trichinella pseudospiralis TaxID=6337 RepID=A0A0V1K617_TRIPS|nr:Phospholipase A-2-activating protein [Trichinella pseudospiralis]KRY92824.1 Phospholipase A-2-activating protein [Trichinella pseudospiralis]KRZ33893.1 Phospholipase A-2-activating protein [Trichinella pseudospiralis]KRZ42682.1 Phospholipase A-2-activating protein [Trichinella pseudospiralis]
MSLEKELFVYRGALRGHSKDVRCLCELITGDDRRLTLATGSRDCKLKIWRRSVEMQDFELQTTIEESDGFISSMAMMPAVGNDWSAGGALLASGKDAIIRAYDPESLELIRVFIGHTNTVCSLACHPTLGWFASASWDCTIRLWKQDGQSTALFGHTLPVWAVIFLGSDSGDLLSGSADQTIKLWKDGVVRTTFNGHEDCVRDLAVLTGGRSFLSCSNDFTCRMWNVDTGQCTHVYNAHEHYVYSLSCSYGWSDWFASASEDHTVRIWDSNSGTCLQTIRLPCQTVWAVCALSNGDVACACNDGVVRIFTPNKEETMIDPAKTVEYETELAFFYLASQEEEMIAGMKKTQLPGLEALNEPGKQEGAKKMILNRSNNQAELYQWSSVEQRWLKFGDIIGTPGQQQAKPTYLGKQYDYVFDVDVEDGQPPIKLPYNTGDDVHHVAQTFIRKHNLPQAYLNDVVNFIEKNTVRNEQPRPAPGNFDQDGSDPLTGAARYVPMQNVVEKLDPLKPVGDDIPLRRYQVVDNFSAKQLSNKLKEFNEAVLEEDRIRSSEMDSLEKLLSTKPCKPNRDHLLLVEKMLCWPTEHLVPVIDLLRLVILDGAGCEAFFVNADRHLLSFSCSLVADKHSANYSQFQTVVCRLFANSFLYKASRQSMLDFEHLCLPVLVDALQGAKKSARIAAVAALANYAYVYHQQEMNHTLRYERKSNLLNLIIQGLQQQFGAAFRLMEEAELAGILQLMLTLLWGDRQLVNLAKTNHLERLVSKVKDCVSDENNKHNARTIEAMLTSI